MKIHNLTVENSTECVFVEDGQICENEAGEAEKKKRLRVKGKFYVLLRKVLSGF